MKRVHVIIDLPSPKQRKKKIVRNVTVYEQADGHARGINGSIKYEIVILLLRVNNDSKFVI